MAVFLLDCSPLFFPLDLLCCVSLLVDAILTLDTLQRSAHHNGVANRVILVCRFIAWGSHCLRPQPRLLLYPSCSLPSCILLFPHILHLSTKEPGLLQPKPGWVGTRTFHGMGAYLHIHLLFNNNAFFTLSCASSPFGQRTHVLRALCLYSEHITA